ncbi:MAG: pantoate--beta-alanine ligase [Polyangia bacterium]
MTRTLHGPDEMRAFAEEARAQRKRIAFVPTMGALHEGHGSLLVEARRRADVSVLSIFVNPLQFAPTEDLARYPRTLKADLARAEATCVDVVYLPTPATMYPPGYQTTIDVAEVARDLDGASRPGHFTGVATVVCKLFSAVRPHVALFGLKDYQQLQVVRRMTLDLDLGVDIVGMPIVRDGDGLALSSRNVYLSTDERRTALAIPRALGTVKAAYERGARDAATLLAEARALLAPLSLDYLELRDATSLLPVESAVQPVVILVAARVGKTRLIDNLVLGG